MRRLRRDRGVTDGQVQGVFRGPVSSRTSTFVQHCVRTLIENDRLSVMPEIGMQFAQLVDARQGSAEAQITSAFAMDERDVSDLVAALEKKFEIKLKPFVEVDPTLIGGVRVVVGDRVLDTSVRSRLDAMKAALVA